MASVYDFKEHYKEGRDSCFSRCCMTFFLVRLVIYRLTGFYINCPQIDGTRHVLCPFHFIKHLFVTPVYHTCDNCNWQQYRVKDCVRCKDCKHDFPKNEPKCNVCGYERNAVGAHYEWDGREVKNTVYIYDRDYL